MQWMICFSCWKISGKTKNFHALTKVNLSCLHDVIDRSKMLFCMTMTRPLFHLRHLLAKISIFSCNHKCTAAWLINDIISVISHLENVSITGSQNVTNPIFHLKWKLGWLKLYRLIYSFDHARVNFLLVEKVKSKLISFVMNHKYCLSLFSTSNRKSN